ncbi:Mov34/MPN/PAD-1 family protein [Acinetobacter nosocomialis]|uniref:CBASS system CD-NTase/cGAS isopeptidase Cap3 n=1 Tax=Acinetobacter calcoaceticus/baumannii complex TaxID=909768 RepID=UPI00244C827D|nr:MULTISPECIES: Mov34/MPN/PAD-1 family protein [Acinetobacter calcoaceticus/baumannii complex]MDH2636480.1 Mov34/MPN/PAD-1 family protein [Acinetobacter nosocomialis]WNX59322.1 Mov34/MPN/PAD-1 family protein [Acinetobacter baumannii]
MLGKDLVFKADDDALVVILSEVVEILLSYRQLENSNPESAGVIIGERRGIHLVVRMVSVPNFSDIRSRFSVNRIGKHHQEKVDTAFRESNGTWQYLGEWHTHPENIPSPSMVDYNSWKKYLSSPNPLILIIVGRTKWWVGKKINQEIKVLEQI